MCLYVYMCVNVYIWIHLISIYTRDNIKNILYTIRFYHKLKWPFPFIVPRPGYLANYTCLIQHFKRAVYKGNTTLVVTLPSNCLAQFDHSDDFIIKTDWFLRFLKISDTPSVTSQISCILLTWVMYQPVYLIMMATDVLVPIKLQAITKNHVVLTIRLVSHEFYLAAHISCCS